MVIFKAKIYLILIEKLFKYIEKLLLINMVNSYINFTYRGNTIIIIKISILQENNLDKILYKI